MPVLAFDALDPGGGKPLKPVALVGLVPFDEAIGSCVSDGLAVEVADFDERLLPRREAARVPVGAVGVAVLCGDDLQELGVWIEFIHEKSMRCRTDIEHKSQDIYPWIMKIIGILETVETGAIERTESECTNYRQGFEAMRRMLRVGVRLLSVSVER